MQIVERHPATKTYLIYSWRDFEDDVRRILQFLSLAGRDGPYTGIFAIPRGGLVLGVRLSHELDLPLIWGGVTKDVLIVDEICDKGSTLQPYIDRGCDSIVIHRREGSSIRPTFWAQEVPLYNHTYVVYPWESNKEKGACYA